MVAPGDVEVNKGVSYTYEKLLGQGTYGEVWKAQRGDDTPVAIKVYKFLDAQAKDELDKEMNSLIQISPVCQQWAVCLLDFYYQGDTPRLVMEYISGMSMWDYERAYSLAQRLPRDDIAINLVLGLDALHNVGVTHQDLKGANIMWDSQTGRPRYVDWGTACIKSYCTIPDMAPRCVHPCGFRGTLYTTPPEMSTVRDSVQTFEETGAHDIWSLGVILYDWFSMPDGQNPNIYYTDGTLNASALSKQNQARINNKIAKINNPFARQIIRLLLDRDPKRRLSRWGVVVALANWRMAIKPEDYTRLKKVLRTEQFDKLFNNLINESELTKRLTPKTFYMRFSLSEPGNLVMVYTHDENKPNRISIKLTETGWLTQDNRDFSSIEEMKGSLVAAGFTDISENPTEKPQVGLKKKSGLFPIPMSLQKSLCEPARSTGQKPWRQLDRSNIYVVPQEESKRYWCFTKEDLQKNYDPSTKTFYNPYTSKRIPFDMQSIEELP